MGHQLLYYIRIFLCQSSEIINRGEKSDKTGKQKGNKKCPEPESNQRHVDFQSTALPTELSGRIGEKAQANARDHGSSGLELARRTDGSGDRELARIYEPTYIGQALPGRWAFVENGHRGWGVCGHADGRLSKTAIADGASAATPMGVCLNGHGQWAFAASLLI